MIRSEVVGFINAAAKLGRTALVQSALIAANYSPYLKRFYEQVKARRGAGKAIIALARKFLGHHLPDVEEQMGVRGLSQFRTGGGIMKTLGNPPPGILALVPTAPSVVKFAVAERCSAATVRCAAATPSRPCLLRAVLQQDSSRRTAPPGTRGKRTFFVLPKTKTRL